MTSSAPSRRVPGVRGIAHSVRRFALRILAGRVVSREAKDLLAKPEKEKPQKKQAELEAVLESE